MKNILIICKDIYPIQSPRSFRASELVKEFVKRGFKVKVVCSLSKDNFELFKKEFSNVESVNVGTVHNFLDWRIFNHLSLVKRILNKYLYHLLQYPNIELLFKVKKILKSNTNKIDLMISIAYPFPIHWGVAIAKKSKIENFPDRWIADCGDPFMGNPIINPPFYFKFLENLFCRMADKITIPVEIGRKAYYKEFHEKIEIIPQGFDFSTLEKELYNKNNIPTFLYAGIFYKGSRDPRPFLDYLTQIKSNFRFIIYTSEDSLIKDYKEILGEKLIINSSIPRIELLKKMSLVDFLLNIENESENQTPSKLIDYSLSGRPILSVSMKNIDKKKFNDFLNGIYHDEFKVHDLERYNIVNVVNKFLEI
ncbi:glycosyltransferase family protein [Flavobacterium daemonense]|uniref:glycosyltransferase family 4 protein n=1 Tax=Flavobacterium daemonense TaxID=1393049 RepID=UPI001184CEAD|nr:glycosyltransferase family 4 protein [Flavobacterium daemonense]KAF2333149.1 glycosyltransferase family 4 protein [Flavobacterium daemonense]